VDLTARKPTGTTQRHQPSVVSSRRGGDEE